MVVWSVPARNDLKNIHDYIARDSYLRDNPRINSCAGGKNE